MFSDSALNTQTAENVTFFPIGSLYLRERGLTELFSDSAQDTQTAEKLKASPIGSLYLQVDCPPKVGQIN